MKLKQILLLFILFNSIINEKTQVINSCGNRFKTHHTMPMNQTDCKDDKEAFCKLVKMIDSFTDEYSNPYSSAILKYVSNMSFDDYVELYNRVNDTKDKSNFYITWRVEGINGVEPNIWENSEFMEDWYKYFNKHLISNASIDPGKGAYVEGSLVEGVTDNYYLKSHKIYLQYLI